MRYHVFTVFSVACLLILGCGGGNDGPKLAKAMGTVTYKGQPVSGATVSFIVEKAPIATGFTDAEGKFSLATGGQPGAPLGTAMVSIVKFAAGAEDMSKMTPADMAKMAEKSKMVTKKPKPELPIKYSNPESSALTATVVADETKNVFEFPLAD